jgi:sulfoxide reductase heme-binding subunit YedZ
MTQVFVQGTRSPARARAAAKSRSAAAVHPAVWAFRLLLVAPFVMMAPEIIAGVLGRPDAVDHLQSSGADVLGNAAFVMFALMLLVTPLATMTGWRWHVPLRRDYGLAMFAVAVLDLVLSAISSSERFPGGFMTRVAGHSFLAVGTLATLLCIPLALTANRRAQRALGGYWKHIHRITYGVWFAILLHLVLLFGFHGPAIKALEVSVPLLALRLPQLRRWGSSSRKTETHRGLRIAVGVLAAAVFIVGLEPFVHDLATSGSQAFTQQPED